MKSMRFHTAHSSTHIIHNVYLYNTPDFCDSPTVGMWEKSCAIYSNIDNLKWFLSFPISRMRCTDISAEDAPDGNWVIAEAMFSGEVNGTVMMVKTI